MMKIHHTPVMWREALAYLGTSAANGTLIDCTCGEGGHSELFLRHYPKMQLIALDRDRDIQQKAKRRLSPYALRTAFELTWFDDFLDDFDVDRQRRPAAILFDFGISVYHYAESQRGFSFREDEPLDMRLDADAELSASDIVNSYPQERLADVIYQYGEERFSRRIAAEICRRRKGHWIDSSSELAEIVSSSMPKKNRYGRIHPATRTFQALRIEVNGELDRIERALRSAVEILEPGGRIGVISFHSLEDRIVKHTFKRLSKGCTCPTGQQHCTCDGHDPIIDLVNRKPIVPGPEEVSVNPPSRSAKFRFVEKR